MRRPLGQSPRGDMGYVMPNVVRHPFQEEGRGIPRFETVSQFDVRLCRGGIPMMRVWRPLADARGDTFPCHSEVS